MATTTFKVGDITIHRIVEQEGGFFDPLTFFPSLTPEVLAENKGWMTDGGYLDDKGQVVLCIQAYLVQTPHHNILIDSCVGNDKPRATRPFWDKLKLDTFEKNFAATGVAMDKIDYVMCTHLHVDHVGWNTKLVNGQWVPTFTNAKYVFSDRELEYWTEQEKKDPANNGPITDSVLPIVAAKREQVVKSDFVLNDIVKLIPTPGHTIDHYSVQVGKAGADAVITGDMIHSPLQAKYPDLGMRADYNSPQAGESRRKLFSCLCETSTLVCTAHFPSPSSGRMERAGDGFKFVPV